MKVVETLIYFETFVCNNPCIYRFKRAFECLASNQVVGGFESLRARHLIKELRRIQQMYYPTNCGLSHNPGYVSSRNPR